MALEAFWKAPFLGDHMLTLSVCMAGGGGVLLCWPVAKPDVICVTAHSTELSNPSPYWAFVCRSYNQLHPISEKVSKVLWAQAEPGRRDVGLPSAPPPLWGSAPYTGLAFPAWPLASSLNPCVLPNKAPRGTRRQVPRKHLSVPARCGTRASTHFASLNLHNRPCELPRVREPGVRDGKQLAPGHTAEKGRAVAHWNF